MKSRLPLGARRVFRFAASVTLALVIAYGLGLPLAFLAPLIAATLGAKPGAPPGLKGLAALLVLVTLTLGIGLYLVPLLEHYAFAALLMIASGVFVSHYLSLARGQALVGTLLGIGLTMIPAAGVFDYQLARLVIHGTTSAIAIAIVCQWIVYPWFPEDIERAPEAPAGAAEAGWVALRATLIAIPALLAALANPAAYMPLVMKSLMLGQESSTLSARQAGRELIGSTIAAGACAIVLWFALKLWPSLYMFALSICLFAGLVASRLFGVCRSRLAASFWQSTFVTTLILLGPAIEDSANGKDVYQAFAVRLALFIVIAVYATCAIAVLEALRKRHLRAALPNIA